MWLLMVASRWAHIYCTTNCSHFWHSPCDCIFLCGSVSLYVCVFPSLPLFLPLILLFVIVIGLSAVLTHPNFRYCFCPCVCVSVCLNNRITMYIYAITYPLSGFDFFSVRNRFVLSFNFANKHHQMTSIVLSMSTIHNVKWTNFIIIIIKRYMYYWCQYCSLVSHTQCVYVIILQWISTFHMYKDMQIFIFPHTVGI